ncbi:MAG: ribonuclease E/G [Lachnospiraceae bacterium]|nr:ribonuclease E/G [uncultured Acetatifactor sp.]MCI8798196.1 ribonuclease E/G [Lachnospiraceae bacterium]
MSRKIEAKPSVTLTDEEAALRKTERGKLLFTSYQGRNCALFLENDRLVEASFFSGDADKIGAIYIGRIKSLAKNMDACFVEIAGGEICFLPLQNATAPYLVNRRFDGRILEGDELLVQVVREAQKTKRASVTAHISLSNEYFVLSTGTTKVGYSLKLNDEQKNALKRTFTEMAIIQGDSLIQDCNVLLSIAEEEKMKAEGLRPEMISLPSTGLIMRTKTGEAESAEELLRLFFSLSAQFIRLLYGAMYRNCFTCMRAAESRFKSIIDQFCSKGESSSCISKLPVEIITDRKEMYDELKTCESERGDKLNIRLYQDTLLSLSSLYSLEKKLENAFSSHVWLKSGGFLVIEPTEALTVIDVNSGKYEAGRNANETYRKINLEAGEEVARQLRLRNLSGIIIVDFINMRSGQYRQELLHYMRELTAKDRISTRIIDITPLGLMEITRKKINKPLREQFKVCPRKEDPDGINKI